MSIIWLASYPKSGSTWVRSLLANYILDQREPADINDLQYGMLSLLRPEFDDLMGLASSDMTERELRHYRPIYHRCLAEEEESPLFIKTHEAYRHQQSTSSFFKPVKGCKVVHLVRNPLDIAVSFAHHQNTTIDHIISLMADPNSSIENAAPFFNEQMGDWSSYTESWLKQVEIPLLTVRYEDLTYDVEKTFTDIVLHSGLRAEADRIKTAVENAQFKVLQRQETKHGFRERQPTARSFFREGKVGNWKQVLTTEQISAIATSHGESMAKYGYDVPFLTSKTDPGSTCI